MFGVNKKSKINSKKNYSFLMDHRSSDQSDFKWIWKTSMSPKVQLFWRKICWDKLPCKIELGQRGILHSTNSIDCDLDDNLEEFFHVVIVYLIALQTWVALSIYFNTPYQFVSLGSFITGIFFIDLWI